MNKLIILIGIPASGKSTHAKEEYLKRTNYKIICPDTIRKEKFNVKFDIEKENQIWTYIFDLIRKQLTISNIVIDATNLKEKRRAEYVKIAKETNSKIEAVIINEKITECLKRNNSRDIDKIVPNEVMDLMIKDFNKLMHNNPLETLQKEGFDDIEVIYHFKIRI